MARHSLSGKLTLLFIAMAVLFVLLVGSGIGSAIRHQFRESITPHLVQYLDYIRAEIGTPPERSRAEALSQRLAIDITLIGPDGRWSTAGEAIDPAALELQGEIERGGNSYSFGEWHNHQVLVSQSGDYTLIFASHHERRGWGWQRAMPLIILLAILILLYHATKRIFAPIATLKAGVERIGSGELAQRIELRRKDELGELAQSINGMADDIQRMLDAKRELLLAISHELRSPLTRAKLSAEFIDDPAQRSDMVAELNAMEALIEELLETERLSAGVHTRLNRSPTSWQQLVAGVVEQHFAKQCIGVELPSEELTLEIDAARLRLLLKNLIENALRHTPEGREPPRVTTELNGASVTLRISDHGDGIEPRHLAHITEPFYRVDPARQRETGGYGLGLYLCRMIAEAHGGALRVESVPGEGTRISVSLPLE